MTLATTNSRNNNSITDEARKATVFATSSRSMNRNRNFTQNDALSCHQVRDLYRDCVQAGSLENEACSAVLCQWVACSKSDK